MRQIASVSAAVLCGLILGAGHKVDTSDMELMYTTAYYCGEITANGSKVHHGGAACNPHLGDVAIVYNLEGEYLGTYEINDTGSSEGLQNGDVIDVYRKNLTMCNSWMKLTGGRVYVQWVHGNG